MEDFVAVLRAVIRHGVQWGACCDLYHVHLVLEKNCIVLQPIIFRGELLIVGGVYL